MISAVLGEGVGMEDEGLGWEVVEGFWFKPAGGSKQFQIISRKLHLARMTVLNPGQSFLPEATQAWTHHD